MLRCSASSGKDSPRASSNPTATCSVLLHGGFLSVTKDRVAILAEGAELRDEIDVTRTRAAYERAKAQGTNSAEAEAELRRARAQLLATGEPI